MTIRSIEQIQKDISSTESELSTSIAQAEQLRWNALGLLQHVEQASSISYRLGALRDEQKRAKVEEARRGDIWAGYIVAALGFSFLMAILIGAAVSPLKEGIGPMLIFSIIPFGFFVFGFGIAVSAHTRKPK